MEGTVPRGSQRVELNGTLHVDVTEPLIAKGRPISGKATTSYSVVTSDGTHVAVTGDIPAGVSTGASFSGTVAVPSSKSASPLTSVSAGKPAPIAAATITTKPAVAVQSHVLDLVVVNLAGVAPLDTTTYNQAKLLGIAKTAGDFWVGQSQKNNDSDPSKELAIQTTQTVTTVASPGGCDQNVEMLWDQAAVALGYTSAQNYLDTPPAGQAHHLVVMIPSGCQSEWGSVGTVGAGIGSSGLIEEALGFGVDDFLLAHELGDNFGLGSADVDFCGRTTAGPNCTDYQYGDAYDVMGAAFPGYDAFDQLNSSTRAALGWFVPGTVPSYALAAGETSHTWSSVSIAPLGTSPDLIQLVDPATQQVYYLEFRHGQASGNPEPIYWTGQQISMDADGKDNVLAAPGIRLLRSTPGNGSIVITEPDKNYPYNDASAIYGATDYLGRTEQNPSVQNETGTITVTSVSGGVSGAPMVVSITLRAPRPRLHDYSGDGHPDVLARNAAGALLSYHGNGTGGWSVPTVAQIGSGWNAMTAMAAPGDFNGDGYPDVLGRDSAGVLWLYPGNGAGGWSARKAVGTGWNVITKIVGVGDFNGDGFADIVATDTSGRLILYPGNGSGGWLASSVIGSGWGSMAAIVGIGDFNGDGQADVVAEDSSGLLWLYPHSPGGWHPRIQIGSGWAGMSQLHAVGDFDGDGTADLIARDPAGNLWNYRGTGNAGFTGRVQIGSGWGGMNWLG